MVSAPSADAVPQSQQPAKNIWHAAITAASLGEVEPIILYLSSGGDAQRLLTVEDVEAVADVVDLRSNQTLVDVALKRENSQVVNALLSWGTDQSRDAQESASQDLSNEYLLRRTVSRAAEGAEPGISDLVREEMRSSLRLRADRLPYIDGTHRNTFFMSKELETLPADKLWSALGELLEVNETQLQINDAISRWSTSLLRRKGCCVLYSLYTSADLNCLLHAVSLAMTGVRDSLKVDGVSNRGLLRDATYRALRDNASVGELLRAPNSELRRLTELAMKDKTSLEAAHVFALANIVRRPIVVYAPLEAEPGRELEGAMTERMSGVYLPLAWDPGNTCKDPLCLGYTRGHFSALVGSEAAAIAWAEACGGGAARVPLLLIDEQGQRLPVAFSPSHLDEEGVDGLLQQYLHTSYVEWMDREKGESKVDMAAEQHVPPLEGVAGLFRKVATPDVMLKDKIR
ncbi:hypothetical protein CYMTET_48879 [Cymbomonas tetramitiformis]|uniref:OTU domain-containing protein n=1 Tax=Cymbomonas tetramitiformis TaxID=36881 RepID=A0AAE0EWC6_9CHLO|nr:hypothetical protein CYMTET_48879 [Cymbomonas tetramitiformis]